jgi:hypothetical protein
MATSPARSLESEGRLSRLIPSKVENAQGLIAWSSFFFAVLQSICTFFAAVDGLRLVIGLGSLALGAWVGTTLDRVHTDWIRVPMILAALIGSTLNILILMQLRNLRSRPASQWRQRPLTLHKVRMERLQWVLSVVTLTLVVVEEYLHFRWCGHL